MTLTLILALFQEPLKPWKIEDAVSLAITALKEGSEPKDWRPALKEHLNGFLDRVGKDGSTDSLRFVFQSFEKAFAQENPVLRKVPEKMDHAVALSGQAKGKDGKQ